MAAPLGLDVTLPQALDASQPDLELLNHPIFSFFQSETNPLIRGVKVDRYRKVPETWKPSTDQSVEVIARLRDKSPLILEKKLGQGEVI